MVEEQYDRICKPRLDNMEDEIRENHTKINDIHRVVMNGLRDKTSDNHDRIKALDNRLWVLLSGVTVSIGLQVVFYMVGSG